MSHDKINFEFIEVNNVRCYIDCKIKNPISYLIYFRNFNFYKKINIGTYIYI